VGTASFEVFNANNNRIRFSCSHCGQWHNYYCIRAGIITVSSSGATDSSSWHVPSLRILVYLTSSSCLATPLPYAQTSALSKKNELGTSNADELVGLL